MEVMVRLYNGAIKILDENMELVGVNPTVLFRTDESGQKEKVGKVRSVFVEKKENKICK